jgi:hypothetical protein
LRDCRPDQVASSGQIFGTLSKAENLQRAFAGGGKGLARAAARPALAKMSGHRAPALDEQEDIAGVRYDRGKSPVPSQT